MEEEEIEVFRDFFEAALPVFTDFMNDLDDIDPPAEVQDAHIEAVDAGGKVVELFQDFNDKLSGVETTSELEELFDDPEFAAAGERFDQACFALQGIADANGIAVNLNCEDEE